MDYYEPSITKTHLFLHFVGRSVQKNTETVLFLEKELTLVDPYNRYTTNKNVNRINTYQTKEQLCYILNSHNIHICCSLYESWGHYLYEGLSTGAEIICSEIPTFKEQLDPDLVHFVPINESFNLNYEYDRQNIDKKFPLRKSFYINNNYFIEIINNFKSKGNEQKRRNFFKHLIEKNSQSILNFLKFI